jgi:hypothetical protein
MSVFATCSPDLSRYKEFCKNGGIQLYMPLFTMNELLTIGAHMREQSGFPEELKSLYTDQAIRESYDEYGGIIRHVLPSSQKYYESIAVQKRNALRTINWRQYFANPLLENPHISHFIVKYIVDPPYFTKVTFDLVSDRVESTARELLSKLDLSEMIACLKNADPNLIGNGFRSVYEIVVSTLFVSGKTFERLENNPSVNRQRSAPTTIYKPNVKTYIVRQYESFDKMATNVLYMPKLSNFALVDFYYKEIIDPTKSSNDWVTVTDKTTGEKKQVRNMKFVGINTCMGISPSSINRTFDTFHALKTKLRLPDELLFEFIFCPHQKYVYEASVKFDSQTLVPDRTVIEFSILAIPELFGM